jgi:hypothetical protein
MLKCCVKLADQQGNLADLLLMIVHVPVGLFLKPKLQRHLTDCVLNWPKLWVVLWPRHDRKPPQTGTVCNHFMHLRRMVIGGPVGPLLPIFFLLKILLLRTPFINSGGVMVRRHFPNLASPIFDVAPPSTLI